MGQWRIVLHWLIRPPLNSSCAGCANRNESFLLSTSHRRAARLKQSLSVTRYENILISRPINHITFQSCHIFPSANYPEPEIESYGRESRHTEIIQG